MNQEKIIILGGAGFLGKAMLRELFSDSPLVKTPRVTVFDCGPLDREWEDRVTYVKGDIRDFTALADALRGADTVFHLASVVDWGSLNKNDVYGVNVTGTENVIRACAEGGVRLLVYTGSLDAIYPGKPVIDGNESLPYPEKHPNMYCKSKALAEQLVLAADSRQLRTVAIRPAGIYGEGDPYHLGSLAALAEKGPYVRIGDGSSKCMHVYVGNVAAAHLQAAGSFFEGNTKHCGKVYFALDSPGRNFFEFFDTILTAAGYRLPPPDKARISCRLMYIIGSLAEFFAFLLKPFIKKQPKVSRFAVTYTCNDFTLTSARAAEDFGYAPRYSEKEAFNRTVAYYIR